VRPRCAKCGTFSRTRSRKTLVAPAVRPSGRLRGDRRSGSDSAERGMVRVAVHRGVVGGRQNRGWTKPRSPHAVVYGRKARALAVHGRVGGLGGPLEPGAEHKRVTVESVVTGQRRGCCCSSTRVSTARTPRGMHESDAGGALRGAGHDVSGMGAPEASSRATRTIRPCAQRGQRNTSRPVSASMHSTQVCGGVESAVTVTAGRS
jgi:hypothetical protein